MTLFKIVWEVDGFLHRHHAPKWLQRPVCLRVERMIGVPEDQLEALKRKRR